VAKVRGGGEPVSPTKFETEFSRTTNRTSGQRVSINYNVSSRIELLMLSSTNMDSCLNFNRPGRGRMLKNYTWNHESRAGLVYKPGVMSISFHEKLRIAKA
jgi:hypothetical protein